MQGISIATALAVGMDHTCALHNPVAVLGFNPVTDTIPPTVTAPTVVPTLGAALSGSRVPVTVSWTAIDAGTGVASSTLERKTGSGAWVAQALPTPTVRTLRQLLASGSTFTYRVSATDGVGNTSDPAAGPAFSVRLVQQTSSVSWSGPWTSQSTSSASGGSLRYASKAGASATFTFTGRAVAWVAPQGTRKGKARVYLDGTLVKTVDLKATASRSKRVVFAWMGTSVIKHRLKIVCLGTAGRPRIDVDAFAVLK